MNDHRIDWLLARQRHDGTLGTPTGCPGEMECRGFGRAAGQNEVLEGLERCFVLVDEVLERADLRGPDRGAARLLLVRCRQLRADREQVALDRLQRGLLECGGLERGGEADRRVRFVHVAVGAHPGVVLRHSLATEESRLAGVTRLRVDLHAREPMLRGNAARAAGPQISRRVATSTALARESRGATSAISSSSATTVTCDGGGLRAPAPPAGNASTNCVTRLGEPQVCGAWKRARVSRAGAAPFADSTGAGQ